MRAVEEANERQKGVLAEKVVQRFGGDLTGRRFALWGLAFKPNTDDMREAPSRVVIDGAARARRDGVRLRSGRDGRGTPHLRRASRVSRSRPRRMDAVKGADALVIMTEWKAFRSPDFDELKRALQGAR